MEMLMTRFQENAIITDKRETKMPSLSPSKATKEDSMSISSGYAEKPKRNITATLGIKHGLRNVPEYENWHNMKQRCLNPNFYGYVNYGGRGITICQRWIDSFVNFYEDMGKRPTPSHSIDRIDNDKGYTPENCRWATKTTQIVNRRMNRNNGTGFRGVRKNRAKWAAKVWVDYKPYSFGSYADKEEAASIYDQVIMQLYGQDAQTNFDWSDI